MDHLYTTVFKWRYIYKWKYNSTKTVCSVLMVLTKWTKGEHWFKTTKKEFIIKMGLMFRTCHCTKKIIYLWLIGLGSKQFNFCCVFKNLIRLKYIIMSLTSYVTYAHLKVCPKKVSLSVYLIRTVNFFLYCYLRHQTASLKQFLGFVFRF